MSKDNICYCGAYGGGKHTKSSRCDGSPEPGPDLACEGFVPDPHSRFCDKCGYPQHEHRRAQKAGEKP